MKPVLIVEGKAHEIKSVHYLGGKPHSVYIIDDNDVEHNYHDIAENVQHYTKKPLQIDFNKYLKYVGQHDDIFDSLNELIEQNQLEIQLLADEIANDVEEKPFAINEKVQERKKLKERTYGLMDAQEIVQAFMQDDVDLSGGEEVD